MKKTKTIKSTTAKKATTTKKSTEDQNKTKAVAKTIRKPRAKKTDMAEQPVGEVAEMNIQFAKGTNNNDRILTLYSEGKSNKEIAKQLSLGVGEVKLVIDLYNSGK